jgi:hypothetical protein
VFELISQKGTYALKDQDKYHKSEPLPSNSHRALWQMICLSVTVKVGMANGCDISQQQIKSKEVPWSDVPRNPLS